MPRITAVYVGILSRTQERRLAGEVSDEEFHWAEYECEGAAPPTNPNGHGSSWWVALALTHPTRLIRPRQGALTGPP